MSRSVPPLFFSESPLTDPYGDMVPPIAPFELSLLLLLVTLTTVKKKRVCVSVCLCVCVSMRLYTQDPNFKFYHLDGLHRLGSISQQ